MPASPFLSFFRKVIHSNSIKSQVATQLKQSHVLLKQSYVLLKQSYVQWSSPLETIFSSNVATLQARKRQKESGKASNVFYIVHTSLQGMQIIAKHTVTSDFLQIKWRLLSNCKSLIVIEVFNLFPPLEITELFSNGVIQNQFWQSMLEYYC